MCSIRAGCAGHRDRQVAQVPCPEKQRRASLPATLGRSCRACKREEEKQVGEPETWFPAAALLSYPAIALPCHCPALPHAPPHAPPHALLIVLECVDLPGRDELVPDLHGAGMGRRSGLPLKDRKVN